MLSLSYITADNSFGLNEDSKANRRSKIRLQKRAGDGEAEAKWPPIQHSSSMTGEHRPESWGRLSKGVTIPIKWISAKEVDGLSILELCID